SAINGLPILSRSRPNLDDWYRDNIQGGAGSFTIAANGFEDVGRALEQKLRRELTDPSTDIPSTAVPEPTTILGILLAGGGLACLKRRQRSI
ncbi:MAG TPA: PEP-CTERM sorting domain-containing protein, partial [Cyanobacteria bacterium UBA8553]|nr:PEP-CTERM sorting domain-containing protein [Cyanobacteria bacterium UBA8553]